jgi:hypothetical protein
MSAAVEGFTLYTFSADPVHPAARSEAPSGVPPSHVGPVAAPASPLASDAGGPASSDGGTGVIASGSGEVGLPESPAATAGPTTPVPASPPLVDVVDPAVPVEPEPATPPALPDEELAGSTPGSAAVG